MQLKRRHSMQKEHRKVTQTPLFWKKSWKKTSQKMQTKLLWMQVMPTVLKSVSKSNLIILEFKQGHLRCLFQHRSLAIFFFECCTHFDYSSTNLNNNSIQYLKDVLNLQKQFKSVIDALVWKILEKKNNTNTFLKISLNAKSWLHFLKLF